MVRADEGGKVGPGMQALKIAVIVMGVLIVAGTTALVVLIGRRLASPALTPSASVARLDEPAGSRIIAMARVSNGLALALSGGGQADRVIVIDPATGRVLRRIGIAH